MHTRYETRGIVLSRAPLGETHALITILTPEFGLLRARAESVRQSGAKLAPALTTFTESMFTFVRGKDGWRIVGAVLEVRWLARLERLRSRLIATRIAGLITRLMARDVREPALFQLVEALFTELSLTESPYEEEIEILSAVRILGLLGFDPGDVPGTCTDFSVAVLSHIRERRTDYVSRINRGITASGL